MDSLVGSARLAECTARCCACMRFGTGTCNLHAIWQYICMIYDMTYIYIYYVKAIYCILNKSVDMFANTACFTEHDVFFWGNIGVVREQLMTPVVLQGWRRLKASCKSLQHLQGDNGDLNWICWMYRMLGESRCVSDRFPMISCDFYIQVRPTAQKKTWA